MLSECSFIEEDLLDKLKEKIDQSIERGRVVRNWQVSQVEHTKWG